MSVPTGPAWWLIDTDTARPLAGPFRDRIDCGDAGPGLEESWEDVVTAEQYGVLGEDGTIELRDCPEDKAWAAHLSEQLDRLADGWGQPLDGSHAGELAREAATALVVSGFEIHHCAAKSPLGGVCLMPLSGQPGVGVSWAQHDRQAIHNVLGYETYSEMQDVMNYALAEALAALGFEVQQVGERSAHKIVGRTEP